MTTSTPSTKRAELRSWYLLGLAPKLAAAARAGTAEPAALAAVDKTMRELLLLTGERARIAC